MAKPVLRPLQELLGRTIRRARPRTAGRAEHKDPAEKISTPAP